jgi:2-methylfumaryl-CoA hydratase
LYALTEVIERIDLSRDDLGALRLRLIGVKNEDPSSPDFEPKATRDGKERYRDSVVLDLDYTVLMPKRR